MILAIIKADRAWIAGMLDVDVREDYPRMLDDLSSHFGIRFKPLMGMGRRFHGSTVNEIVEFAYADFEDETEMVMFKLAHGERFGVEEV